MTKEIIQHLLENQGFVSSLSLSNLFRQPIGMIEWELKELHRKHPGLLSIDENIDGSPSTLNVKIAEFGEELARSLL